MNEKELGMALLNLDLTRESVAPDPSQRTDKILRRDRRSLRLLAGLAILFWIIATSGLVSLIGYYLLYVTPRLRAYGAGRAQLQNDWNDWAFAVDLAAGSIVACIVALLLAAICTTLLIVLSRRATLRQINVSLAEISQQLKQLRQASLGEPKGPSSPT